MANVTYYLGAGASINAIPAYDSFNKEFLSFCKRFESVDEDDIPDYGSILKSIKVSLTEIKDSLPFHRTPDTLAKRYFHQGDDGRLQALKELLILFFLNQQSKTFPDQRYDSFIASILEPKRGSLDVLSNFSVLSWNYDVQFELTYAQYYRDSFKSVLKKLNVEPSFSITESVDKSNNENFKIIHLNGLAYAESDLANNLFSSERIEPKIEDVLACYADVFRNRRPGKIGGREFLKFSWENFDETGKPLTSNFQSAIDIARKTDVLVFIGYSFPIFNSAVDQMIISEMENLKKVYIQNPEREIYDKAFELFFKDRFTNKDVIYYPNKDSFIIPNEWDKDLQRGPVFTYV